MAVMEVAVRAAPNQVGTRPRSTVERPSASTVMSSRALLHAYHRQGDLGARARLIEDYLPLVRRIARQHAGRGESLEDLVQVGSIGLINAIDRFELDRGGRSRGLRDPEHRRRDQETPPRPRRPDPHPASAPGDECLAEGGRRRAGSEAAAARHGRRARSRGRRRARRRRSRPLRRYERTSRSRSPKTGTGTVTGRA